MTIDNKIFSEVLPKHEHLTLHILLSILACVVVLGSIYFYKVSLVDRQIVQVIPNIDNGRMSAVELAKAIETLNRNAEGQATLSSVELKKITDKLNKRSNDQKPMTQAEIQEAIKLLNKK